MKSKHKKIFAGSDSLCLENSFSLKFSRKGMEFGFNWLFAIIVGAIIIFAAIYATNKLIGTEETVSDTLVAAQLSNLLNPIETTLEDSKYTKITFTEETRVYNDCNTAGSFGKQQISTASKIGTEGEFGRKSVRKSSFNKYIFSREYEQGKNLHVIVKPFEMPYKVGDLTFLYSGEYCFVNAPSDIEDEINDLSAEGVIDIGINLSSDEMKCPAGSVVVCFNKIGCDINVNTGSEIVSKNGEDLAYEGNLLYGAILSDRGIYECQISRLMKRASELAYAYAEKADFVEGLGCSNNIGKDLRNFAATAASGAAVELNNVMREAELLEDKNDAISRCKVF